MKSSSAITTRGAISAGRGGTAVFASGAILLATTTTLFAQSVAPGDAAQASATPFNVGRAFTFLFLTLGPFKVFGPFAAMTRGCDSSFKTRLAFQSILIAAAALLVAVTAGTRTLRSWEISVGALQLSAALILILVALRQILEQYAAGHAPHEAPPVADPRPQPPSALAFSPLAFPTIVTPYGIAVLIMLVTLREGNTAVILQVYALTALVLALDLLAMLTADRILKTPVLAAGLAIAGVVMGVLQVAVGVQAFAEALHMLGLMGSAGT
jgi:multiple antibiotic resistance protein